MLRYERDGKGYKIFVNRGYGFSMGNMLEIISGQAAEEIQKEQWIKIEKKGGGRWEVVDDNMTVKKGNWVVDNTALGFTAWDDQVTDLDKGYSDESQCFNMSGKLQYGNVVMTPESFTGGSIEDIAEALSHVEICSWCPGDI